MLNRTLHTLKDNILISATYGLAAGGIVLILLCPGRALAGSIDDIQALDFSTAGQSLWAPGTGQSANLPFSVSLIHTSIPAKTIGGFNFGFGATLSYSGDLELGLSGNLSADAGKVNAGYSSKAQISVDKSQYAPGQVVTIHTSNSNGATTLASQFTGLDASLAANLHASAHVNVTTEQAFVKTTDHIINVDKSLNEPLLSLGIHGGQATVKFGNGTPIQTQPDIPLNYNIGTPYFGIPFINDTVSNPVLNSSNTVAGNSISNSITPIPRTCGTIGNCPINPTDFNRTSINVAVLTALISIVPGLKGGVPLISTVEADLYKDNLSAIEELSQRLSFDANPTVKLKFSQPTNVETTSGLQQLSSYTVPMGQDVKLIQPNSDLTIDPVYSVANNSFTNNTQFLMQFLNSLQDFHFSLSGLAFDDAHVSGSITLATANNPLGGPIYLGPLDPTFSLQGFQDISGTPFTLAAVGPGIPGQVPEPRSIYLFVTALLALAYVRRRWRPAIRTEGSC